jgi:hypothetical protein
MLTLALGAGSQAQSDRMVDWQPIETAPKDGTRILLWDTDEVVIAK